MAEVKKTCWNEAVNGMANSVKEDFMKRTRTDEDFSTAIYAKYQLFCSQQRNSAKKAFDAMTKPLTRKAGERNQRHPTSSSSSGGVTAAADQHGTHQSSRGSASAAEEDWTNQNYYQRWDNYNWWKHSRWW